MIVSPLKSGAERRIDEAVENWSPVNAADAALQ
jgi:hypothetical protein